MKSILAVGDMHVVPSELDDCNKLLSFIIEVCRNGDISEVWFAGDQHHTHAVVRLEVIHWWMNAFTRLRMEGIRCICLVGNHDQLYPGSNINVMEIYRGLKSASVDVIDRPSVRDDVLLIPYCQDEEEFRKACVINKYYIEEEDWRGSKQEHGCPTVFCHQTFDGSTYENGFPAHDGFQIDEIPQERIISGHIHTGQEFGKVWYIGAPRWRNLNDANVSRAIWKLTFDRGRLVDRKPFGTASVCRQILHLVDTEAKPVELPLQPNVDYRIDIKGSKEWCQVRKAALKTAGAKVRTFPTLNKAGSKVKESDGIAAAFRRYLDIYDPKNGTDKELLLNMGRERLNV